MITKEISDIKNYATVSSSFTYNKLKPHLQTVATNEIVNCIGETQYATLENYSDSDALVKKVIELIKDAETNLALFYYLPIGGLQITNGGVSVIVPKGQDKAPEKDLRDSLRYYKKRAFKALDKLLELMESDEDKFSNWVASTQYSKFKALLVNSTADFQAHHNIFNSRQTFMSLVSEIKLVELKFVTPSITNASLIVLKTSASEDEIFTQVKNLVAAAIVLFTVSKTLGSGLYYQSASGFELRFDVLDYERNFNNSKEISTYTKSEKREKATEATQLLKTATQLIKANPQLFAYVVPKTKEPRKHFIAGKSIIAI